MYAFFRPILSEIYPPISAPKADPKALQPSAPRTPLPYADMPNAKVQYGSAKPVAAGNAESKKLQKAIAKTNLLEFVFFDLALIIMYFTLFKENY